MIRVRHTSHRSAARALGAVVLASGLTALVLTIVAFSGCAHETNYAMGSRQPFAPGAGIAAGASGLTTVSGPFEEVWIVARGSERGARASAAGSDSLPGTGSLVLADDRGAEGEIRAFPLQRTSVRAGLSGPLASVRVEQVFLNPYNDTIEAAYVFPLPHDAAVSDFLLTVGDRRIRGVVRERKEAERLYAEARSAGYVASLLTEERPNIFTERVANIEPGHRVSVELTYFNMLDYANGEYEWRFPLVVGPRFNPPGSTDGISAVPVGESARATQPTAVEYLASGERTGHDVSIDVEIDAGTAVRNIRSTSHSIVTRAVSPNVHHVELSQADRIPNRDFVLRYQVAGDAPACGVVSTKRPDGEGYFALTIYPPAEARSVPRAPVEMVYVIDRSGSMSGHPIQLVKEALRESLAHLRSDDTFQIVDFSNDATALGGTMLAANESNLTRARRYVDGLDAGGGTMVLTGLAKALSLPHVEGRVRYLVFLTDAYVGNEREIIGAIHRTLGEGRVFGLGVGSSPNWFLLYGMAKAGQGAVASIGTDEDASESMRRFMDRISHPVMHGIALDWTGVEVDEVWPSRVPDLVTDAPVTILGKYRGGGAASARLRGRIGDVDVEVPVALSLATTSSTGAESALDRLWARAKIAQLSDDATWNDGDPKRLAREMLATALQYGISSPYTAFIVVDASRVTTGDDRRTIVQPVPMPEGVSYETTVSAGGS